MSRVNKWKERGLRNGVKQGDEKIMNSDRNSAAREQKKEARRMRNERRKRDEEIKVTNRNDSK